MTIDKAKLKGLAERCLADQIKVGSDFHDELSSGILALLAEIERAEIRLHDVSVLCATVELERGDLKAEVAGLRTGYQAYEQVNAELKAEVEVLRTAALYGAEWLARVTSSDGSGHADLARATLRKAGYSAEEAECQVGAWVAGRAWKKAPLAKSGK